MSLFLPFNNRPTSTSVKTSTYIIPAGKYARVIAYVEDGGTFSIDGLVALESDLYDGQVVNVSATGIAASYTVPAGYFFEGQAGNKNAGEDISSITIDGNDIKISDSNKMISLKAGPGSTVTVLSGGLGTGSVLSGYARKEASRTSGNTTESFWLPTGATLTGAGSWRAVVEEYDIA